MSTKVLCLLLLVCFNNNYCLSYDVPEIETPLGKIAGVWKISNGGKKYAAFEGIPYAKPPIGELRFEAPEPAEPWPGVLNATQTHSCSQGAFLKIGQPQGKEDCLYLNVYIPHEVINSQRSFDVLVHIHGGAFLVGSAHMMFDSRVLLDRDVIFVSINYRVGILGFLSTEDEAIPGNNGMKDQVLALRWVKENIASFGGNPDSVTIAGISAGGASVHLHYFSPLSKRLFVRGLSQSGTALCPWVIKKNPLVEAKKLATLVGCPETSTSELKQCLKEKPVQQLLENMKHFSFDDKSLVVPFAPVIEKPSANAFLTGDPYLLLKEGKVHDLPWITSTTTDEGLLTSGHYYAELEKVDSDWLKIAHFILSYDNTLPVSEREEVARKIKEFYLGPGEHINKDNFKKFTQIFTDRLFATDAETAAKLQSRVNKSPVFYYLFNYKDGENSLVKLYASDADVIGVGHGEDILYCYSSMFFELTSKSDLELRTACLNMLYSFATTGKPSFDGTDKWQPTKDSELVYLNISGPGNMNLQRTKHLTAVEFWSTLGLSEKENLKIKDEL